MGISDVGDWYIAIDRRKGSVCTDCKNEQAKYKERLRWKLQQTGDPKPKRKKPLSEMNWQEKAEHYRLEQTVAWIIAMFDNEVEVVSG